MTVRLYMDEHVPRAITAALRRRGVDALTAQDDGRLHTPDPEILDGATLLGCVVFTLDHDFLKEATRRLLGVIKLAPVLVTLFVNQCLPNMFLPDPFLLEESAHL